MEKSEITTETVLNACRAAYKKGMIEAAQDICTLCCRERPIVSDSGEIYHDGQAVECAAAPIIRRLEWAGGWQVEWPVPVAMW